jgi:cytosine/adenosine deaminase-related metal-dependent hydrolase
MMRRAICSAAILLLPFVAQITSLLAPVPQDRRVEGGDGRLADTVLINGRILTVDAEDTVAEAVAVTNGKIAAVGSNVDGRRLPA